MQLRNFESDPEAEKLTKLGNRKRHPIRESATMRVNSRIQIRFSYQTRPTCWSEFESSNQICRNPQRCPSSRSFSAYCLFCSSQRRPNGQTIRSQPVATTRTRQRNRTFVTITAADRTSHRCIAAPNSTIPMRMCRAPKCRSSWYHRSATGLVAPLSSIFCTRSFRWRSPARSWRTVPSSIETTWRTKTPMWRRTACWYTDIRIWWVSARVRPLCELLSSMI